MACVACDAGAGDGFDRRRTGRREAGRGIVLPGPRQTGPGQWRANLPTTINERRVNILQGTSAAAPSPRLYFDVETGLLTRVVRYASSAMGRVPTQIDFEDYRDVAGVKIPFKWSFAWVSGRDVIELTEVQANVAIDAGKFGQTGAGGRAEAISRSRNADGGFTPR